MKERSHVHVRQLTLQEFLDLQAKKFDEIGQQLEQVVVACAATKPK